MIRVSNVEKDINLNTHIFTLLKYDDKIFLKTSLSDKTKNVTGPVVVLCVSIE